MKTRTLKREYRKAEIKLENLADAVLRKTWGTITHKPKSLWRVELVGFPAIFDAIWLPRERGCYVRVGQRAVWIHAMNPEAAIEYYLTHLRRRK
jgi:hypothetical protein